MRDTLFWIAHSLFWVAFIFTQITKKSEICGIIGIAFQGVFIGAELMYIIMQFV